MACAVGAVYAVHGWRTTASAGRPRRRRRGAARARLRVQALPRRVRRPAGAAGAHRARSRRGAGLAGRAAGRRSPPRSRSCWSTCRSRSRATRAGGRRSRSRSCARSTSPPTRSGTGASGPESEPTNVEFQAAVDRLSPALVLASFVVALAVGWWRWRRERQLPVDRGQRRDAVRLPAAAQGPLAAVHAVAAAVLRPAAGALGLGRRLPGGRPRDVRRHLPLVLPAQRRAWTSAASGGGFAAQAVAIGVWGRAVLLAGLFVVALRVPTRTRRGSARSRYRGADELSAGTAGVGVPRSSAPRPATPGRPRPRVVAADRTDRVRLGPQDAPHHQHHQHDDQRVAGHDGAEEPVGLQPAARPGRRSRTSAAPRRARRASSRPAAAATGAARARRAARATASTAGSTPC